MSDIEMGIPSQCVVGPKVRAGAGGGGGEGRGGGGEGQGWACWWRGQDAWRARGFTHMTPGGGGGSGRGRWCPPGSGAPPDCQTATDRTGNPSTLLFSAVSKGCMRQGLRSKEPMVSVSPSRALGTT